MKLSSTLVYLAASAAIVDFGQGRYVDAPSDNKS
jgi:hypothetical protein